MTNLQKRVFEGMERVAGGDEKGYIFFFFLVDKLLAFSIHSRQNKAKEIVTWMTCVMGKKKRMRLTCSK
jgi:hypothetical protein